jgi:hypothetical protein
MPALRPLILVVAHCLMAVVALACPASAQDSAPRYYGSNASVVEFSEQRPQATRRIAVIGDVERPGVYESSARRLVASTVLTATGSHAGPGDYFWRFHGGLRGFGIAMSQSENTDVLSGDVIVVPISPRRKAKAAEQIHLAVIGLGPDPSVIRVPRFDCSLPSLFSRLRQPGSVAASATVNGVKTSELLKDGDVIVVSSHLVDRASLGGCDAILPIKSLDTPVETPKATTEWSPPVNVDAAPQLPLLGPHSVDEVAARPEAVASVEPSTPAREEVSKVASLEVEAPILDAKPSKFVEPAVEAREDVRRPSPIAARRHNVLTPDFESDAVSDGDSQIRNLVIFVALGTLGLGVAMLWLASERRLRATAAPAPVPLTPLPIDAEISADDELGELIRGELPVEDEPVVLPSRIALHGEPVGQKRLVVHPPQALAGPHFGSPASTPEKAAAASESRPASPPVRPGSSSSIRSAKDTEGLLDRVLLAMQREGRR